MINPCIEDNFWWNHWVILVQEHFELENTALEATAGGAYFKTYLPCSSIKKCRQFSGSGSSLTPLTGSSRTLFTSRRMRGLGPSIDIKQEQKNNQHIISILSICQRSPFIPAHKNNLSTPKLTLTRGAGSLASFPIHHHHPMADNAAPAPAGQEQLNLKVKSQDGEEVFFKIKSTTQLKKLMDAYCQRQSLNAANVRFLFDGERLHEGQTPKDLNMENGDEIDVVIEQVGGN